MARDDEGGGERDLAQRRGGGAAGAHAPIRVLVVEDDPSVAGGLVRGLRRAGFEVELATDGINGLLLALQVHIDVVLLDLLLPGRSGFEVLQAVQDRGAIPIIVLTARAELHDRLQAFALGAVDFIAKPFWLEEVIARIRARLHVAETPKPSHVIAWANASADLDARTVHVDGAEVALTRTEFELLTHLLQRPGRAIAREQLATRALSALEERNERTVDSHLTRVRRKLGDAAASHIVTVWGIGYRFDPGRAR